MESLKISLQEKSLTNETLAKNFRETSRKFEETNEQLLITKENASTLSTTLKETQNELDKIIERCSAQDDYIRSMEARLNSLENDRNECLRRLEYLDGADQKRNECELLINEMQEEVNDLSSSLNENKARFERERAQKAEEIKNLYEQLSSSRSEIRELKEETQMLKLEKQTMLETLEAAKEQSLRNKSALAAANKEIKEYKKILDEREMDSAKLHTLGLRYQADVEHYEKEIRNLEDKLKGVSRNEDNMNEGIKELQEENSLLFETNREMEKKLNEMLKKDSNTSSRLSAMQNTIETCLKNVNLILAQLKRRVNQTTRSAKSLNFPKR